MAKYFTDFSEFTLGHDLVNPGIPGLTGRWWYGDPANAVRGEIHSGYAGIQGAGKQQFKFDNLTSGRDFSLVSFDQFDNSGDVELVGKMTLESSAEAHLILGASGTGAVGFDWPQGYSLEINFIANQVRIVKSIPADEFTELAKKVISTTFVKGDFYLMRFRREGITLKGRLWRHDETEPEIWQVQADDADFGLGWIGMGATRSQASDVYFDFIGIGTDGSTAPMQTPQDQIPSIWTPVDPGPVEAWATKDKNPTVWTSK